MPSESLTVQGNALITGTVLKPSDQRIKENITAVNTSKQLENISNLKIYDYELKQWKSGTQQNTPRKERGVLAQELQTIIPEAVQKLGDVQLKDGSVVHNLLVVNERVLLFENIGATQQISKILEEGSGAIDEIDSRVEKLEEGEEKVDQTQTRIDQVIEFVTNEEFQLDKDEGWCCYCSIFGMGPAWTLFILGFFFWIFWLFGVFYIFSCQNRVRRFGGAANLLACILSVMYLSVIPTFFPIEAITISLLASFIAGVIILSLLAWHQKKKMGKRKLAKKELRSLLEKKPTEWRLQPKLYSYSVPKKDDLEMQEITQEKRKENSESTTTENVTFVTQ